MPSGQGLAGAMDVAGGLGCLPLHAKCPSQYGLELEVGCGVRLGGCCRQKQRETLLCQTHWVSATSAGGLSGHCPHKYSYAAPASSWC